MPPNKASNKAAPATAAKVKPPLDLQRAQELNLQVLKRKDPDIDEILGSSGHVVLYDFNKQTKGWVSKNIEGSLFVVKRRGMPRFQMFLLNKKGNDDFTQSIADGFTFQIEKPYLFYKLAATGEVIGVWFYDVAEADKIQLLLTKIIATFPSARQAEPPAGAAAAGPQSSDTPGFFGWKANVPQPSTTQAHAHQPLPGTPCTHTALTRPQPDAAVPPGNDTRAVEAMLQAAPAASVNPLELLMGGSKMTAAGPSAAAPQTAPGAPPAHDTSTTALLEQLLKGSSQLPALPAPAAVQSPTDVARTLLERLARNERVVSALAEELVALGLISKP